MRGLPDEVDRLCTGSFYLLSIDRGEWVCRCYGLPAEEPVAAGGLESVRAIRARRSLGRGCKICPPPASLFFHPSCLVVRSSVRYARVCQGGGGGDSQIFLGPEQLFIRPTMRTPLCLERPFVRTSICRKF